MMVLDYTLKHFSVSSSLVFCVNSVQKMCSSASYRITMKTQILRAHIFRLFLNIGSSMLRCHFKYFFEKDIKSTLSYCLV